MNNSPSITKLQYFYLYQDLLSCAKEYLKNSKRVDIFCSDYELFISSQFCKDLFTERIKDQIRVVHTRNTLQKNNIIKQASNITNPCFYKIISETTQSAEILLDFVNQIKKSSGKADCENLSEIIDGFMTNNPNPREKLNSLIDQLCNNINKQLNKQFTSPPLSEKTLKSIQQSFEEIKDNITKTYKEGETYAFREILGFFLNIISFNKPTKVSPILLALDVLYNGGIAFSNILEWSKNKYTYAILSPIIKLLASTIAPILTLFNNNSLIDAFVFDGNKLLDFSGFNICNDISHFKISQNFAFYAEFEPQSLQTKSSSPSSEDKENKQSPTPDTHEKKGLNSKLCLMPTKVALPRGHFVAPKDITKNNILFSLLSGKETEICIPKSSKCILKTLFSFTSNQSSPIKSSLLSEMKLTNQRFAYIESPFFNSKDFIDLIKETQKHPNPQANPTYNYLIISNAPNLNNSNLTSDLVKSLGNEIQYESNTPSINRSSPLIAKPSASYEASIDYSKYEIKINPFIQSYVLTLSPFVRIPREKYEKIKSIATTSPFGMQERDEKKMNEISKLFKTNLEQYQYFSSFFKQPKDFKSIQKQEEQFFKEGIELFKDYFKSIITTTIEKTSEKSGITYKVTNPKQNLTAIEVYLLALTLHLIKNTYGKVEINPDNSSSYEYIKADGESINVLAKDSYLQTLEQKIPICLAKSSKKEGMICIEEIVELFDAPEPTQEEMDKQVEDIFSSAQKEIASQNEIQSLKSLNEESITQTLQALQSEKDKQPFDAKDFYEGFAKDFIASFFPFMEYYYSLNHPPKLFLNITKTLLNFSVGKLSEALKKELGDIFISFFNVKTKILYRFVFFHYAYSITILSSDQIKTIQESISMISLSKKEKEVLKFSLYSFTTNLKANLKESAKTAPLDIGKSILSNALSSLITNYERQKKEYERILFLRYTNKYNAPYALQREEAVYIPMPIFNTLSSFNFHTLYSGINLCSGGLGMLPALFALFRDKGGEISQTFLLTKLFAYLCLDELRGGKILKDEKGKYITIEDDEFFQKVFKSQTSRIEFDSYRLTKIRIQERERGNMYEEYYDKQGDSKGNAIGSYEVAMAYLQDIANGNFNTTRANQPFKDKHREFIIALDEIGKNNVKALYVGIDTTKKTQEKRPKLIGRLATTIIPKGGLWIG